MCIAGYQVPPASANRLEVKNGELYLSGAPLKTSYGRRGVQVGCYYVTYEALDKLSKDSEP